ncbi:hypothetical protein GCM10028819_07840 [Spirosoma humi]
MNLQSAAIRSSPVYTPEPLPEWLADQDSLRDEGVLFGLSEARPDGKISQIRAFFSRQTAPLTELADENTERIGELNLFIEQRENRIISLRNQINELVDREPRPNNLIRTLVSLILSLGVCVGNFYLIDETLRPLFPNRLIAVGIFLAGMFNLFSRTSFLYEAGAGLSVRRILAETGLPLAASVFVFVQALQSQSMGQAIALFAFVFFLFLLAGNLFLSNLVTLQTDLANMGAHRRWLQAKAQSLPVWEAEIERLSREVDSLRVQKWPFVTTLNHVQAQITHWNTRRDELVNLFVSEFELARSLRDRLSEQQRKSILTGSPVRI